MLIVGFSTLFVGGLGVFNSVQAYLQGKLGTIATLRSVGLRDRSLSIVYLLQILIMSGLSCLAGAVLGFLLSFAGALFAATQIQVDDIGRIVIARPLRELIALGKIVRFVGNASSFEIWSPEDREDFEADLAEDDAEDPIFIDRRGLH